MRRGPDSSRLSLGRPVRVDHALHEPALAIALPLELKPHDQSLAAPSSRLPSGDDPIWTEDGLGGSGDEVVACGRVGDLTMRCHRSAGCFGEELDGAEPGGGRMARLAIVLLPVTQDEGDCRGQRAGCRDEVPSAQSSLQ